MSTVHRQLTNALADQQPTSDAAQDEQNAANGGLVQGQGIAQQAPVGSAAPAQNTAGAKDGVNEIGSISTAQRKAIGGTASRGSIGPELPVSASSGYQSPQTKLDTMKADATAVATHVSFSPGEPSEAELMNTLSEALNKEYQTTFQGNIMAGMANVNAKEEEVKDVIKEVHGERIHAAEQLGAALGSAGTQGMLAYHGASLMGNLDRNTSKLNEGKDSLHSPAKDRPTATSADEHGTVPAPAQNDTATRHMHDDEIHTQQVAQTERTHETTARNQEDRDDSASLNSHNSELRSVAPSDEHATSAVEHRPEGQSGGSSVMDLFKRELNPHSPVGRRERGPSRPARDSADEINDSAADPHLLRESGSAGTPLDQSRAKVDHNVGDNEDRKMNPAEMKGEALKAAAQSLGSVVQNSADLIDKLAGGQHEADEAKISQKQDQVNAQIAQNNQEALKGNKEQTNEAIKNMYQAMTSAIQRHADMINQIAQR